MPTIMKSTILSRFVVTVLAVSLMSVVSVSSARADQAHMQAALNALQTAKAELQAAEHDKGGHRDKALEAVDRAINQTRLGINAGV